MPADLGTGFIPNSPELTAAQIAGPSAMQQAAQTLAQAEAQAASSQSAAQPSQADSQSSSESATAGQQSETADDATPRQANPMPRAGGIAATDGAVENQKPAADPLTLGGERQGESRAQNGTADGDIRTRQLERAAWFTKLPPEQRKAIEARARRPAPRGYEQRLRRYFESLD